MVHVPQQQLILRQLGLQEYQTVSRAMHLFTEQRHNDTLDEVWLVQHYPVFTQGQAGKAEHLLTPSDIPVVQSDRGGQITYHAPGQQIMYTLLDLKRAQIGVRELVTALENSVINTLASFNIAAYARPDAPGVYVNEKKICSLGLRIRRGYSFHGLALNIDMDLSPFGQINPCGYPGMEMTQVRELTATATTNDIIPVLVQEFTQLLGYQKVEYQTWNMNNYE